MTEELVVVARSDLEGTEFGRPVSSAAQDLYKKQVGYFNGHETE